MVLTAERRDFSTESNVLHNPARKSCRAFFQPSLFNTPSTTTRKFLMSECESHLVPAWFHLPGRMLRAVSMEQQVTVLSPAVWLHCPHVYDKLWAEGSEEGALPAHPLYSRATQKDDTEGPVSSFYLFLHPHFRTQAQVNDALHRDDKRDQSTNSH